MNPYRHLTDTPVVVRLRDGGTIHGVLHNVIRKTAWMLVPRGDDSLDEFVNMADIAGIDIA